MAAPALDPVIDAAWHAHKRRQRDVLERLVSSLPLLRHYHRRTSPAPTSYGTSVLGMRPCSFLPPTRGIYGVFSSGVAATEDPDSTGVSDYPGYIFTDEEWTDICKTYEIPTAMEVKALTRGGVKYMLAGDPTQPGCNINCEHGEIPVGVANVKPLPDEEKISGPDSAGRCRVFHNMVYWAVAHADNAIPAGTEYICPEYAQDFFADGRVACQWCFNVFACGPATSIRMWCSQCSRFYHAECRPKLRCEFHPDTELVAHADFGGGDYSRKEQIRIAFSKRDEMARKDASDAIAAEDRELAMRAVAQALDFSKNVARRRAIPASEPVGWRALQLPRAVSGLDALFRASGLHVLTVRGTTILYHHDPSRLFSFDSSVQPSAKFTHSLS